jgi:chitinase
MAGFPLGRVCGAYALLINGIGMSAAYPPVLFEATLDNEESVMKTKAKPFQTRRILAAASYLALGISLLWAPSAYATLATPTLSVSATSGACSLSWNTISGATGYDVYRDSNWYKFTTSQSYADAGLTNGTTYKYTVAAQNDTVTPIDTSAQSAPVNCTPGGTPSTDVKFSIPGTSVTASANDGNVPANTVDGSLSTRWSASGDGQWIKFDLGASKKVTYIKIAFYDAISRTNKFDVQASTDNVTFTTVQTGLTSTATNSLQTFNIPDVSSARYVRIVGHGNTANLWNSFTEVEVYGGDATTPPPTSTYQIIGYYPGWTSATFPANSTNINANHLTVINYAFLDICWNGQHGNPDPSTGGVTACKDATGAVINPPNGSIVLGDAAADPTNLKNLVALKSVNSKLKVVGSVGGWSWSNQFSNMASSSTTRTNFINSAVSFVRQYKLDGIDIDWEYPTSIGVPCTSGNTCQRSTDKQNFVTLVQGLRSAFDSAGTTDGKHYSITVASGADSGYVFDPSGSSAWLVSLVNSLDWINIMTYDYHGPWDTSSGNVAPLYRDPADTSTNAGVFYDDYTVTLYRNQGIPASKIVLGEPFYGYGWSGCSAGSKGDGLYQPCTGAATGSQDSTFDFAYLTNQGYLRADTSGKYTIGGLGFTRYWNSAAKTPYLYNPSSKVFITYDDEASIHEKNNYIITKGLRGGMFWELNADMNKTLGNVIANDLPH